MGEAEVRLLGQICIFSLCVLIVKYAVTHAIKRKFKDVNGKKQIINYK